MGFLPLKMEALRSNFNYPYAGNGLIQKSKILVWKFLIRTKTQFLHKSKDGYGEFCVDVE